MPTFFATTFGPQIGSMTYSYFFTSNSISTILLSLLTAIIQDSMGFDGMFYLTCGTTVIALLILVFLRTEAMEFDDPFAIDYDSMRNDTIFEKGNTHFNIGDVIPDFAAIVVQSKQIMARRLRTLS